MAATWLRNWTWAWALLLALAPACHFDQNGGGFASGGDGGDDDGDGDGDGGLFDAGEPDASGPLAVGEAQLWIGGMAMPSVGARRFATGGDAWLDDGRAVQVGGPRFIKAEMSPTEPLELVLVQSHDAIAGVDRLTAYAQRGATLEPQWSEDLGAQEAGHFRAFDLAFEQGGNALVVWTDRSQTPHYRNYSAGGWSLAMDLPVNDSVGPLPDLNDSTARWVELEAGPVGDEIALVYSDDNDRLAAMVWTGSAWDPASAHIVSSFLKYNIATLQSENQPFDVAWEQLSNDLLIAWGRNDSNGFGWTQYSGGVWSATVIETTALPDGQAHEVDLATQPGTDRIALGLFDLGDGGVERLGVGMWTGGAWDDQIELDPTLRNFDDQGLGRQAGQVAWAGEQAICVYGDAEQGTLDWAAWTEAGGWTLQPDVEIFGKGLTESLLLAPIRDHQLVVVIVDDGAGVWSLRYDGATWRETTPMPLSTDIATVDALPITLDSR